MPYSSTLFLYSLSVLLGGGGFVQLFLHGTKIYYSPCLPDPLRGFCWDQLLGYHRITSSPSPKLTDCLLLGGDDRALRPFFDR